PDLTSHAKLGCLAYREDARQFFYYPATDDFSECEVDKSGRWLVIEEELDGRPGRDNLIVDLESRAETVLPGAPVAGGAAGGVRLRDFDHVCAAGSATTPSAHANEVACSLLDGSPGVLVVTQNMDGAGGGERRRRVPRGN